MNTYLHRNPARCPRGMMVTVALLAAAAMAGLSGCGPASQDSTGGPSTPAVTQPVTSPVPVTPSEDATGIPSMPTAVASNLDTLVDEALAAASGGAKLGEHVVFGTADIDIAYPTTAEKIGIAIQCRSTGAQWHVSLGSDDSRWIGGDCNSVTSVVGTLDALPSDEGNVTVHVATDEDSTLYLMVFTTNA